MLGNNANKAAVLVEEEKELYRKKYELDKNRISSLHKDMLERQQETQKNAEIDVNGMSPTRIEKIQKETREYLEHAKNSKCFINDSFLGKVPFFGRNIILAGAETGHGKTSIGKNLAYHTLLQGGRVMYITNEENPGDVYNGVTCLIKGWAYTEHDSFSEAQMKEFDRMMPILSQRMVVIDDNYNDGYGQTTTLEGIIAVLTRIAQSDVHYDVIIIDYYQNVCRSNEQPELSDWKVQEKFAKFLDSFKNAYLSPIVLLSQLKSDTSLTFKEAIEGRKMINNVATCSLRVTAEREFSRTAFKIEKSRFTKAMGETIYVGFQRGKYVSINDEDYRRYANRLEQEKAMKEQADLLNHMTGGKK